MDAAFSLKWDPYFMRSGSDFHAFWQDYLLHDTHNLLYVLGRGFDPRMCLGLESVLEIGGPGVRDCLLIEFDEGPNSPSTQLHHLASQNRQWLKKLINKCTNFSSKEVQMWSSGERIRRRTSSYNAARIFTNILDLSNYTDVVIDINAMPRAIYFSLIGKVIYLLDQEKQKKINLHVIVYEDATLDEKIRDIGVDDTADFVHGFGGSSMQTEATAGVPKIWIPILGENQRVQLERIHTYINPEEICPVLPHPSRDPRRGDQLLIEYREFLFDQWLVEPRDIVYASERNPFDVYRKICQVVQGYNRALEPIGGCKAAISAQSSKLLSIGALLAAHELRSEHRVGIVHVEAQGYEMTDRVVSPIGELFTLWLAGECYAL